MLRYRRAARAADVVHFQWLSVQALDARLLPDVHPRVLTAHDVLPREPRPGQLAGQRALYERMDAIVVHSAHGAARLRDELGLDPARVHVIPHGALTGLDVPGEAPFARPEQAGRAVLRAAAALQGRRRAARGVAARGARRRAVGRRHAAHGHVVHPRPRRAHRAALRDRRRARGRVPGGRSRRAARTARSTSPACSSRRWRSASRSSRPPWAASRRSRRPSSSRRATRTRSRRRSSSLLGDPARLVGAGRGLAGGRRGPVQLGRDRPADARALLGAPGVDHVVRRPGRLGPRRRPALARVLEPRALRRLARRRRCPRRSATRCG